MLQVHERLGDFEIICLLGKGGMGEVYEARQFNPERRVALKVLAPWLAGDDEALERFWREAAVPANPNDVPLLAQLAQFHERMGRQEPATTLYSQILTLDPTHPAAAINLGTALIRQGKSTEAIALWLRVLAANPGLIGARLNLAVAQFQSGNHPAARKSLEQVLDYEPNHPTARQMLNQIPE